MSRAFKSMNYHFSQLSEHVRQVTTRNTELQGSIDRWLTWIDNTIAEKTEAIEQTNMLERKAELRGAIGVLQSLRARLGNVKRTNRRRGGIKSAD